MGGRRRGGQAWVEARGPGLRLFMEPWSLSGAAEVRPRVLRTRMHQERGLVWGGPSDAARVLSLLYLGVGTPSVKAILSVHFSGF